MTDFDPVAHLDDPSANPSDQNTFDPMAHLDDPSTDSANKPHISGMSRVAQTAVGAGKEFGRQASAVAGSSFGLGYNSAVPLRVQNEATRHAIAHPIETISNAYHGAVDATSRWMDRAFNAPTTAQDAQDQGAAYFQGAEAAVPVVGGLVGGVRSLASKPAPEAPTLQSKLNEHYSGQSMGAAASAPNVANIRDAGLRSKIEAALEQNTPINHDALSRHVDADSLPIPAKLTSGQATGDPVLISNEKNMRSQQPELAEHFKEQNNNLIDNAEAIRNDVGPDVYSANQIEHGDALINAYKAKDEALNADISSKYQALKDANGGQFPIDANALLQNASAKLHQELLFDHAPKAVMSTLGRLADSGNMTFENFESLRTNLARTQRSLSVDGNEKAAAGVIRDAMEDLPLTPGAASLKPLADTARAAAKSRFQLIEGDPAYKAVVRGTITPDKFTSKFITGPSASRDGVAVMRQNLGNDPVALQTMGVSAVDHLRSSAVGQTGNFSQAAFNRNLSQLDARLPSLLTPKQSETLHTLGRVAHYEQNQPAGSFVNNSNTSIASQAAKVAGTATGKAIEGYVNTKTLGLGGTTAKNYWSARKAAKDMRKAIAPGAGITSE